MAGHGADDDLLASVHEGRGHAGVDGVRKRLVAAPQGLHDGRGVDARARAERVPTQERVVRGDLVAHQLGHAIGEGGQVGQITGPVAHEHEVHHELVHGHIAAAFADAEDGPVDAVRAGLEGGDGVGDAETAVVVAVPVQAHLGMVLEERLFREPHEVAHALGRRVAAGVREADGLGAFLQRGFVDRGDDFRLGTGGVLRDHHHGHLFLPAERDRPAHRVHDEGQVPTLHIHANRAGAHEGTRFKGKPDALLDFRDLAQIVFHRPDRGVGIERQPLIPDFREQRLHGGDGLGPRAGHAQVNGIHAQPGEAVEQVAFGGDGRVQGGGALEAIPQGFVVEHGDAPAVLAAGVPVVDEPVQGAHNPSRLHLPAGSRLGLAARLGYHGGLDPRGERWRRPA